MLVEGVLVSSRLAARYGPLLDLAARAYARQNGVQVDAELDALLKELVAVGLAARDRVSVAASVSRGSAEAASESPVMSVDEVAGLLGVTPRRVRQRAQAGEFGRRNGGRWVFDRDEIGRSA